MHINLDAFFLTRLCEKYPLSVCTIDEEVSFTHTVSLENKRGTMACEQVMVDYGYVGGK
jgi:hypothetical protein